MAGALFVAVGDFDKYSFAPRAAEKFDADRDADFGGFSRRREAAGNDDGRKAGDCAEAAVAVDLHIAAGGNDQPLLVGEHDGIQIIIDHDFHYSLPKGGALGQAKAVLVVLLQRLGLFDVGVDAGMILAGSDNLGKRFYRRVGIRSRKISVKVRFQVVKMHADFSGNFSRVKVRCVKAYGGCTECFQFFYGPVGNFVYFLA